VIESVRGCDQLLLVTEPTPFGLNDLKLAVEMARALKLRFGVAINRADTGDREVWSYCRRQRIDILAEIPDDRAVAEAYSRGEIVVESVPQVAKCIRSLLETLQSGAPA
jgi:MinD superfamily P-loop ATPase